MWFLLLPILVSSQLTAAPQSKVCAQYEGRVISYYSEVFKVENCKRRPVLTQQAIDDVSKSAKPIADVPAEVIRTIPLGDEYQSKKKDHYSCRDLEGKYVTVAFTDIFLIQGCKRRQFPEWSTYLDHLSKRKLKMGKIQNLELHQLDKFPVGEPIPSVVDGETTKMLQGNEDIDIISIDEACRGLNGRLVTYYSKVYKIEKCRKRLFDSEKASAIFKKGGKNVPELTSEQWLSLPDGVPLNSKP